MVDSGGYFVSVVDYVLALQMMKDNLDYGAGQETTDAYEISIITIEFLLQNELVHLN